MFTRFLLLMFVLSNPSIIQCDLTNLGDFLNLLAQNQSIIYPIGYITQANADVVKRYLLGNIELKHCHDRADLLQAIDNETIIAGVTTGQVAEDLDSRFRVFSSLIISPQAMLLAPDYNDISTPYGLKNQSSNDLFDALNAAITDVQREDMDETFLKNFNLTDLVRVYTCNQELQLPVINRSETTGYLRDILDNKTKLLIGGLRQDWGVHDGNYNLSSPIGFYPKLLDAIVEKLSKLKGPDGIVYNGDGIAYERVYYKNMTLVFRALLNGEIHATDVYALIDAPYNGTGEICVDDSSCRSRESCIKGICTHPKRPRSLHFRTTCTTASRDTKFITKKDSKFYKTSTDETTIIKQTPRTRWIGFLLLFAALFGSIFLTLLILIRRKKYYRVEHTLQGGFGKFARLQEESEPPLEAMDAFDDNIVQSPRDNTNSTS